MFYLRFFLLYQVLPVTLISSYVLLDLWPICYGTIDPWTYGPHGIKHLRILLKLSFSPRNPKSKAGQIRPTVRCLGPEVPLDFKCGNALPGGAPSDEHHPAACLRPRRPQPACSLQGPHCFQAKVCLAEKVFYLTKDKFFRNLLSKYLKGGIDQLSNRKKLGPTFIKQQ